jgi:hypothetical protein
MQSDEGRNSAVGHSPWDGGAGLLPRGLGGKCGLGYRLVFLFLEASWSSFWSEWRSQPPPPRTLLAARTLRILLGTSVLSFCYVELILIFTFYYLYRLRVFARKTCSRTTFFPSSPTFKILCSTSCRNVLFMTSGRNTAESVLPLPSTTSAPLS